jgi:hypothetical protein
LRFESASPLDLGGDGGAAHPRGRARGDSELGDRLGRGSPVPRRRSRRGSARASDHDDEREKEGRSAHRTPFPSSSTMRRRVGSGSIPSS